MSRSVSTRVSETIGAIRSAPPIYRLVALVLAVAIGLAIALVYWIGFLFSGVALGIGARTFRGAFLGAIVVGVSVIGGVLAYAWWYGQLGPVFDLGVLSVIAFLIPVGLILLGALLRGILETP